MRLYPASLFNAYNICPRQAWLMSRQLIADQENMYLEIGRLIDNIHFKRDKKKIFLADIQAILDMITKNDGTYYIAEIKKSSKILKSGILQLKYYLYLLKKKKGIEAKGIIKIPQERISKEVRLTIEDEKNIERILQKMETIIFNDMPPAPTWLKVCSKCGHFEFCWS